MNADVARLEAERLRPTPEPTITELWQQLIGLIHAAIRQDQAAGKWGSRGRL